MTTGKRAPAAKRTRPPTRPPAFPEGSGKIRLPGPCAYCHCTTGVQRHPRMRNVHVCRDCLERETEPIDYSEIGTGD